MSGVELVGVVASTLQIATCITNFIVLVIDVREELRRGPSKIKEQAQYLTSLLIVLKSLEHNPHLQHPEIQGPLDLLLERVKVLQDKLHRYLGSPTKGPVRKVIVAIGGVQVEQKIVSSLQALDRETSSLQLYIIAKSSEEVHWLSETYLMDSRMMNKLMKQGKPRDKEGKSVPKATAETQIVKRNTLPSQEDERKTKETQLALTGARKNGIQHIEHAQHHPQQRITPLQEHREDQMAQPGTPGNDYGGTISYGAGCKARYGDTTDVSIAWAGHKLPEVSKRLHNYNFEVKNAPEHSDYGDKTNYK